MKIIVQTETQKPTVKWKGNDGYIRDYEHRSVRAAKNYAKQLACRLELDGYRRELARTLALKEAASKSVESR